MARQFETNCFASVSPIRARHFLLGYQNVPKVVWLQMDDERWRTDCYEGINGAKKAHIFSGTAFLYQERFTLEQRRSGHLFTGYRDGDDAQEENRIRLFFEAAKDVVNRGA